MSADNVYFRITVYELEALQCNTWNFILFVRGTSVNRAYVFSPTLAVLECSCPAFSVGLLRPLHLLSAGPLRSHSPFHWHKCSRKLRMSFTGLHGSNS